MAWSRETANTHAGFLHNSAIALESVLAHGEPKDIEACLQKIEYRIACIRDEMNKWPAP